jgi:hypothetical protein
VLAGIAIAIYYLMEHTIQVPRSVRSRFVTADAQRSYFIEYRGLSGLLMWLGLEMILLCLFLKILERSRNRHYKITPLLILIAILLFLFAVFAMTPVQK